MLALGEDALVYEKCQAVRQAARSRGFDYMHAELSNSFAGPRFDKAIDPVVQRPPFSRAWGETRLLAPGALDGLNAEAADAFLVLVNTGLRPSEC